MGYAIERGRPGPCPRLRIEPDGPEAYAALADFHYLSGPPATWAGVWSAWAGRLRAGVLVVSMPTLNGSWRRGAWPGWLEGLPPARLARLLNAELRTISRVVVDPRLRGAGVARALVEHYLRRPLTPRTEAVAAMGRFCPFFARAGMRPVDRPLGAHDRRLRRLWQRSGERPLRAVEQGAAEVLARRRGFVRALRRWARASAATRAWADLTPAELVVRSALRAEARPVVYVHP